MDQPDAAGEIYSRKVPDFEGVATAIFLHQLNSFLMSLRDVPSFTPHPSPLPLKGRGEFFEEFYLCEDFALYSCTISTSAATFLTGVLGRIP